MGMHEPQEKSRSESTVSIQKEKSRRKQKWVRHMVRTTEGGYVVARPDSAMVGTEVESLKIPHL